MKIDKLTISRLRYFVLFIPIFCVSISFSQTKEDDSLNIFKNQILQFKETDSAIAFIKNTLINTEDLAILLEGNYSLSKLYYKKEEYLTAKKYATKSSILAKKIQNKKKLAASYMVLGYSNLKASNNREKALDFFYKGLKTSKKINYHELTYKLLSSIAKLYRKEGDTLKALENYKKSLVFAKKTNVNLNAIINNIGVLYLTRIKDSAIYYFKKSLYLSKLKNDTKSSHIAYLNLGHTYLRYEATEYPKALYHLKEAEKLVINRKNSIDMYYINFYLGLYYQKTGNSILAEQYYQKVLNSSAGEKDIVQKIKALKQIANFYESQAKFNIALKYEKQYRTLKEEFYSLEKNKAFNNIRTKYEVAEKDNKIILLAKENELAAIHKKNIIFGSLALFTILFIIVLFYRNGLKNQKKIRNQEFLLFNAKQEKLEKENELKEIQGYIDGQEKEKNRIALELHDGIAGELAGIKHYLNAYNRKNSNDNTQLKKATNDIALIAKEVRSLSHTLSSDYILNSSFTNLIFDLKTKLETNNNIEVNITIFPDNCTDNLNKRIKHNLYRVLQELINNSLKHAKASSIDISITDHTSFISFIVEDNGIGFDKNLQKNGIGFNNINSRIESIKGKVYIDSDTNRGTTISIEIPY